MTALFMIARGLLAAASFVGLSAAIRVRLGLDRFVAPFVAANSVIVILMLTGFLNLMGIAYWALYALGFAGLVYAYRREAPQWSMILALVLFAGYLVWRFYPCPLVRNDDVSHWGMVAKHLLAHDRLPVGSDGYIYFQSYPVGAGLFIYYVGKTIANTEGIYLVAQHLLTGLLFLPMFSLVRERKGTFFPIGAVFYFLLFHYASSMITLQVDLLLAFFGIGTAAAIARYRGDLRRALIAAVPAMMAVAYVKNSGLFFGAISAVMLGLVARNCGFRRPRTLALGTFGIAVGAYLLWTLHIKLRYPDAFGTKHAVSITAYAAEFAVKGTGGIVNIARMQLESLLFHRSNQVIACAFLLATAALLFLSARKLPTEKRRKICAFYVGSIGVYFLWFILVFWMYVFSMPAEEAVDLPSIYRYNGTGLAYLLGLNAILLLVVLQRTGAFAALLRGVGMLCPLLLAAVVALTAWPGGVRFGDVFSRNTQRTTLRTVIADMRETYGLEDGGRILAYCEPAPKLSPSYVYYCLKNEYMTDNIHLITGSKDEPYMDLTRREAHLLDDIPGFLADYIDEGDVFVIFNGEENLDAIAGEFLESYGGATPIYRVAPEDAHALETEGY